MIEAWHTSNRCNLLLLDALEEDHLSLVSRPRARSVGDQFAHLHNARLMWLEHSAPDLAEGMEKIASGAYGDIERLESILNASAEAIAKLLERSIETGNVKSYRGSPELFFAYLVAHEGHHRGQVLLTLKLAGVSVDKSVQYGIWDWPKLMKQVG